MRRKAVGQTIGFCRLSALDRRQKPIVCPTVFFALALACQLSAASLPENIDRLLATTPAVRTAYWGIQIIDLTTGKTLYELNPEHFFIPASNTKLFTTALALTRLGPDFTFQTRVLATAPPDNNGRIGDLRIVGGGDPNLSARAIPYHKGPLTGNPLVAIEDLADQIAAHGVKRVSGDIVGDDTWYLWQPYATGWSIDDPQSDDGPPVSALTIHDNAFTLHIRPGAREGDIASLLLNPPIEFYQFDNRIRTAAAGSPRSIHLSRVPGSLNARLWGSIPLRDRGQDLVLGIEDPARYAAVALRRALEERGIVVEGEATALHQFPHEVADVAKAADNSGTSVGVELAKRISAPLLEDLRITDKVSQNLHAELALRAVGRARRNIGSFEAGLEELKTFLSEAGVEPEAYNFRDGSGLARLNLVTPGAVVKLLRFMHASPARENWISLLPVGGEDGTLSSRFGDGPASGRVHAKTGSLSHVSALSGYVQRVNGDWIAFSILVNNYNSRAADIRGVMDRICNLILE